MHLVSPLTPQEGHLPAGAQALQAGLPALLPRIDLLDLGAPERVDDPFAGTTDVWQAASWAPDLSASPTTQQVCSGS